MTTALGESMHFSSKSFRLGKGWRRDGENLKGVDFQIFSDDDNQKILHADLLHSSGLMQKL